MTTLASASTSTARVPQDEAREALASVTGMPVDRALLELRFHPGHSCPALERVILAAVADVRSAMGPVDLGDLVVLSGEVGDGDAVTRLRRHAHGDAYWLTTQTTRIEVALECRRGASPPGPEASERPRVDGERHVC
jgi:ribosomal protein L22